MKRGVDDARAGQPPTMVVQGRYLRTGTASLPAGAVAFWERKTVPKKANLKIFGSLKLTGIF